jgi:hypothetical protein
MDKLPNFILNETNTYKLLVLHHAWVPPTLRRKEADSAPRRDAGGHSKYSSARRDVAVAASPLWI